MTIALAEKEFFKRKEDVGILFDFGHAGQIFQALSNWFASLQNTTGKRRKIFSALSDVEKRFPTIIKQTVVVRKKVDSADEAYYLGVPIFPPAISTKCLN